LSKSKPDKGTDHIQLYQVFHMRQKLIVAAVEPPELQPKLQATAQ